VDILWQLKNKVERRGQMGGATKQRREVNRLEAAKKKIRKKWTYKRQLRNKIERSVLTNGRQLRNKVERSRLMGGNWKIKQKDL
jgi:hypothetical protein